MQTRPDLRLAFGCLILLVNFLLVSLPLSSGAQSRSGPPPPFGRGRVPFGIPATPIRMTDVTGPSGLRFAHTHGGTGRHYYIETVAGGGCFFDYNGDGWLDVFLVQGAALPPKKGGPGPSDALYRNNKDGTFTDVTRETGLTESRYGVGCAVADYDNDADQDLFVTNLEAAVLYRNNGKGRFMDVSRNSGISPPPFATGAAFVDHDQDGWLDLFVARYMEYSIETDKECLYRGVSIYCSPLDYPPADNRLYRNNRDGTFSDVSARTGIAGRTGHGFGIATADFNEDGWIDVFVASDHEPNLLFMNRGDGTFREDAHAAGVAVNSMGKALAGMGVDVGDYDNDGLSDLIITNYDSETNSLYRNRGDGTFSDESLKSGIQFISSLFVGWGTHFADLDMDGFQDIFVVNGHTDDRADSTVPAALNVPPNYPTRQGYAQRAHIYANDGRGRFTDVSLGAGDFFRRKQIGRGAAFGDYDNDGDIDVLIANNNQPAILLRNDTVPVSPWTRLELQGAGCNRDALGARVRVSAGTVTQTQFVRSGTSYLAEHDRRLLFALPGGREGRVTIRWPCGATQTLTVQGGQSVKVVEHGHRGRSR